MYEGKPLGAQQDCSRQEAHKFGTPDVWLVRGLLCGIAEDWKKNGGIQGLDTAGFAELASKATPTSLKPLVSRAYCANAHDKELVRL